MTIIKDLCLAIYVKHFKSKLDKIFPNVKFEATRTHIRRDTNYLITLTSDSSYFLKQVYHPSRTEYNLKLYGFDLLNDINNFLTNSPTIELSVTAPSLKENNTLGNFWSMINRIDKWNNPWYIKLIKRLYRVHVQHDMDIHHFEIKINLSSCRKEWFSPCTTDYKYLPIVILGVDRPLIKPKK